MGSFESSGRATPSKRELMSTAHILEAFSVIVSMILILWLIVDSPDDNEGPLGR